MARYNVFYSPRYQKDRERAAKREKLLIYLVRTGSHTDLKVGEN